MKNLNYLLLLPAMLVYQTLSAQNHNLLLSNPTPAAGDHVSFTYDPTGTNLENKTDIKVTVYNVTNRILPPAVITLNPEGKLLQGEFTIPEDGKAFFFKINKDTIVDNNAQKGYVYPVYNNNVPAPSAYAFEASFYNGLGKALAKVPVDKVLSLKLFKQEMALHPESEKQFALGYYNALSTSADPADIALFNKKLNELKNGNTEADLRLASTIFTLQKKKPRADSLLAVIRQRFPEGNLVKNDALNAVMKEENLKKKDSLYQAFVHMYPQNALDPSSGAINDMLNSELAAAYAKSGDVAGFEKYSALVKNKEELMMMFNNTSYDLAQNKKNLEMAEKLGKQAWDMNNELLNNPVVPPGGDIEQVKKRLNGNILMIGDTYAFALFTNGKLEEAFKIIEPLYNKTNRKGGGELALHYMQMAVAANNPQLAKEAAERTIAAGNSTPLIEDALKTAYVKINGNSSGFNQYLASLQNEGQKSMEIAVANTPPTDFSTEMVNIPAPEFTLKDIDGKTVSLAALKGKVVVVDFWATWCGPCKMSFPGMQMAVNKYKNDPNVVFLFVDTWEKDENFMDGVKKFIANNRYSFHVLVDEKDNTGKQAKVVTKYEVSGIPTKFIIDKTGHIRFKYIGYSGSSAKVFSEVTNMITLAGNPASDKKPSPVTKPD